MALRKPSSFSAGRRIVLDGTVYQPGATVPNAVVKGLVRLTALLSSGAILPNADLYARKSRLSTPRPSEINPSMRASL